MTVSERIRDLVAPLFVDGDIELVDVEHTGAALRIVVDRPGGLDLDALTKVTRRVSHLLDEEDPVASRYTLEVTTPGLERPLRLPEHFVRAVGRDVHVKTKPEVPGERRLTGVLVTADDDGIVVRTGASPVADPAASPEGDRRLAYGDIERARTVFEWGPAPKPGKGSKPGAARATKSTRKKKAATS